ncbi:hypothetical protein LCGC14_0406500 [marine sediment metagenome]|uniref:Portal protein n=1 Tax=marine sediment metagenome TaxID=412755 RepID=A0A0F9SV05_9ZZZZ
MPRTLELEERKESIKDGIKFQIKYGESKIWNKYYKFYRGQFKEGIIPANLFFPLSRSLIPRVYFRDPKVTVTATKPGYEIQAKVVEVIDNWIIREIGIKNQLKLMIQDAFFYGSGPGIHGFDSEWGFSQLQMFTKNFYEEQGVEFEEQDTAHQDAKIKSGMPWFLRIQPDDFIVPWGTVNIDTAPWFAYRVYRPLEDVKKDPNYENKKGLKASHSQKVDPDQQSGKEMEEEGDTEALGIEDQDYVELWTIHDAREKKVMVLAPNHDKWLRHDDDDLQIEGLPVQVLQFNPDGRQFWAIPEAKIIMPQQLELNEIRTQQMKHRRITLLKILYNKGKIDKAALDRLLNEDVGAAVAVNGNPNDSVMAMKNEMPQSLSQDAQEVRGDVRESVGFSRLELAGDAEPPRKTKYEVQARRQAHSIRIDERRDIVADLLTNVIRKINQMIFSWWTVERVAPIVGEDLATHWVSYTGPEIRGEYNYKVDPESGTPFTEEVRRGDASALYDMFKGDPDINQIELKKHILAQFRGINPEKFIVEQQMMPGMPPQSGMPIPLGQAIQRGRIAPQMQPPAPRK